MASGIAPFPAALSNHGHGGGETFPPPQARATVSLRANKAVTGLYAMRRDIEVNESPIYLTAGESRPFTVTFEQASSVATTSAKIYKNGSDSTGTNMTGSTSVSGNVVTLPTISALIGSERYVVELTATVDGIIRIVAFMLIVRLNGAELA